LPVKLVLKAQMILSMDSIGRFIRALKTSATGENWAQVQWKMISTDDFSNFP
jgi:hypothetical protein